MCTLGMSLLPLDSRLLNFSGTTVEQEGDKILLCQCGRIGKLEETLGEKKF